MYILDKSNNKTIALERWQIKRDIKGNLIRKYFKRYFLILDTFKNVCVYILINVGKNYSIYT